MKPEYMTALLNADLSNARNVKLCTEAASCLLRATQADIHPGMFSVFPYFKAVLHVGVLGLHIICIKD